MIIIRKRRSRLILLCLVIYSVCLMYSVLVRVSENSAFTQTPLQFVQLPTLKSSVRSVGSNSTKLDGSSTLSKTTSRHVSQSEMDIQHSFEKSNNTEVIAKAISKQSGETDGHTKQLKSVDQNLTAETKISNASSESKKTENRVHSTAIGHRVAIVSLLRNAEGLLESFKKQLITLSYPHHLLSVYFGESESTDNTFKKAENITAELKNTFNFSEAGVTNLQMSGGIFGDELYRHRPEFQLYRRSFLANARNRIVRHAMQKQHFDYIVTIDSDVIEFPKDIVERMLRAQADIVATTCLIRRGDGNAYIYDMNSWRETKDSLAHQASLPLDALVVEGYSKPLRMYLPQIRNEGHVVELDGVGGCALMIKADCLRSGLMFPENLYKRHIETEGLGKMARDMGFKVVGLPFLEVFHFNDEKK